MSTFLALYRRIMSTCIKITFHSLNDWDTQCPFYPEKINGIWMRSNESMNNSVYYFLSINNRYCNKIVTSARFWFCKSLQETLDLNLKVLKNKQLIKYYLIREELRIIKTMPPVSQKTKTHWCLSFQLPVLHRNVAVNSVP